MPLTQSLKDNAATAQQASSDALTAWPDDVPEKAALASQSGTLLAGIQAAKIPPPPSGQQPDPLLICDLATDAYQVGGISKNYFYSPWLKWPVAGGTWTDRTGAAQGNAPFSQLTVPFNSPASLLNIDISGLPKVGVPTQICLRSKNIGATQPQLTFNSREQNAMMQLRYKYDDGTSEDVLILADVACASSTEAQLGGAPSWTLNQGTSAYLRFPPPKRACVGAFLVLAFVKITDASGIIEVYDGTLKLPPPRTETFTLKGDSRVFFETQCFEDAPPYVKAMLFGDPAHGLALDKYHQRNIVLDETGEKVLQISFDPAVNAAVTCSVLFPNQEEADEACVEFEIRFLPDMEAGMDQGFKCFAGWSSATKNDDAYFAGIWGLKPGRCGTLLAGNGGAKSHGYDGWSTRFDAFKPESLVSHPLYQHVPYMQYVYWPGQSDYYGDPWPWDLCGFTPKLNEWHRVCHRLKINSFTGANFNKDAEFDGYIDSHLAVQKRGFYLRTTETPVISQPPYNVDSKLKIGRSWINVYHGGVSLPRARCSFQVRNYRLARFA